MVSVDGDPCAATGIRDDARRESGPGNKSELAVSIAIEQNQEEMMVDSVFVYRIRVWFRNEAVSRSGDALRLLFKMHGWLFKVL